jgi:hypothetical protein
MNSPTFIPYGTLPTRDYYTVALCEIPLSEIEKQHKVKASRRNVKDEGGRYRALAIALPNDRYAQLVTYDARPGTVEILIETFRMRFAHRDDLDEVAKLIGVPAEKFSWIVSDDVIRFR